MSQKKLVNLCILIVYILAILICKVFILNSWLEFSIGFPSLLE